MHSATVLIFRPRLRGEGRDNADGQSRLSRSRDFGITLDRYGHLMPGSEAQAAGLLDAYLDAERERAAEAARAAGGCLTGERTGEQLANENAKPLA